jgi:hypothetical protein
MWADTSDRSSGRKAWDGVAARAFVFSCFFPYPALAIGRSNGLQLSQALALAVAPLLLVLPPGRAFRALLLILTPVYLSALVNSLLDTTPSADILPKESMSLTLALLPLWPAGWVMQRRRFRGVLAAACAAVFIHSLVGFYQAYSFWYDEFPLLFLYQNPSFKSMQEWHRVYALYMKRPCGLFPEPSAMGASLGPWLVLLAGLFIDPDHARAVGWRAGRGAGFALACGFALVALSRSGSTFAIMGSVLGVCLAKMPGWFRPPLGFRKLLTTVLVFLAGAGVVGYSGYRISRGFQDRVESSWGLRGLSIRAGLTANTDPASLAFGAGPGQSTPLIRRELAGVPLPEGQDEPAIFSLTVKYYMETGLVGALALLAVLAMVVHAMARSSAVLLGLGALATWLVGVAATTSYMHLSAIWLFLGAMLNWDELFPPRYPSRAYSL